MSPFSLAVALFDFVPVAVTAIALAWLATGIRARHRRAGIVALCAAWLVPLGGACKASWKLIIALGGPALGWLENLLFVALAPGFAALAFSLHHARRAWRAGVPPQAAALPPLRLGAWVVVPLALAAVLALALPGSRAWFFTLLAATTLAYAALLLHAALAARHARLGAGVTAALACSFVATLALSGLARLPPGEASAWLQEGVNLAAQAALALAFWQLGRRMREVS